jgi:membrane-bound lytic murein transglycosylase B
MLVPRLVFSAIFIMALFTGSATAARRADLPVSYITLQQQLIQQGLPSDYVFKLFADPRCQFLPDIVKKNATIRKERLADYSQFLNQQTVARGREYIQEHRLQLNRAKERFGVAPEVIVGILTVETNLGNVTGKYPVFNVFASLSVMDTPEALGKAGLGTEYLGKVKKRASWARRELHTYIGYCLKNRLDPFSYSGSWAGAMGYSQFLPSSLAACGVDGSGDGKVDLFTHPDAIMSIANYLKKSGFNMNNRTTWSKAVYAYNHSQAYVEAVLTLANWY